MFSPGRNEETIFLQKRGVGGARVQLLNAAISQSGNDPNIQ